MRTEADFNHERAGIDQAHGQNDAGRDSFVGLVHTALFAASIAFVGDVTPVKDAVWKPALIAGWTFSVIGLVCLTFSFQTARSAIAARREALHSSVPPSSTATDILNAVSLWTFPLTLLCLFSFTTANVVHTDDKPEQPAVATPCPRPGAARVDTPAPSANLSADGAVLLPHAPGAAVRPARQPLIANKVVH